MLLPEPSLQPCALGSDHFLRDFPFHVGDFQEPHRVPLTRRNFPVVLDYGPVLLDARAKLDDLETAMQELSVPELHSAVALSVRCLLTW